MSYFLIFVARWPLAYFFVYKLIIELERGSSVMKQSLSRVLSVINYNTHPKSLPLATAYLLDSLKPSVCKSSTFRCGRTSDDRKKSKASIEVRRSSLQALPSIVTLISPHLTSCGFLCLPNGGTQLTFSKICQATWLTRFWMPYFLA